MHSLDPQKTLPEIEREQMGYDHTVVADGLAAQEDARRRSRRNALPPQLESVQKRPISTSSAASKSPT